MELKNHLFAVCASLALSASLVAGTASARTGVDTIYHNGTVITMDSADTIVEAVAVDDGMIVGVGSTSEVMSQFNGSGTTIVNLKKKTLLPGFYDAHSHIGYAGMIYKFQVILNSPPIGTVKNIDEVVAALQEKAQQTPEGEWIQGFGYDDTLLAEMRHPTRYDLDRVSTVHPILITHTSGHLAVANSLALEMAGIDASTQQPGGGVIRKDPNTGEPTGVLEEGPATGLVSALIPPLTPPELMEGIGYAGQLYAAKGVTTGNSGATSVGFSQLFKGAALSGLLPIRVNLWPTLEEADTAYAMDLGTDLLSWGGVKDFADGSIQGYTGYLSEPYWVQPEGYSEYRGYPRYSAVELALRARQVHDSGYQSIIHGNGDAAIDDILDGWEAAQEANPREDTRHVVIHSQMMREDQLDRMQALGAIPSFFVLHTYYWGERHWNIFMGPERAARMSPARSAVDRGMPFTFHCDTPVVPMDPLLTIWAAVNRMSYEGFFIGEEGDLDQRITPMQALRATTIYPAYQNFEEDIKGSIEPGKLADLVILSDNPLEVAPMDIRNIEVIETIVGGETVYQN
ncbi:amidohydrolase [Desulforhopalus singaporensis]|uniref:Amidohydrolase 3 domain-containing protein n=1 Tax=Desulforhopalus singaporensis TaxID=91360 RepID=A0A1H0SDV5_9BACT|nr:amidohydrolase [Desulforhopalus singaporensis]SDP39366.1 hypothetical protein SAMN05660330_02622 [Desulforhopalus singaporensis]